MNKEAFISFRCDEAVQQDLKNLHGKSVDPFHQRLK